MRVRANLLIVDDDEDMLSVLSRWCGQEGFEVTCASDGFEALFKLKERPFDLVLTDLAMPGMHGLKLIDMLKTFDSSIQVVVLTGHGSLETAVEALREGKAFDFLSKPLDDLGLLTRSLSRALERRLETVRSQQAVAPQPSQDAAKLEEITFLTTREREVARRLVDGLHPEEIATQMNVSFGTIKNHLSVIYEKLNVRGRASAVTALRRYRLD